MKNFRIGLLICLIGLIFAAPIGAATLFMETPDATQGTHFWSSVTGTVAYDSTTTPKSGIASWKFGDAATGQVNYFNQSFGGMMAAGRISIWVSFSAIPTATKPFISVWDDSFSEVAVAQINSSGVLVLTGQLGLSVTGSTVLSAGVWYQVTLFWDSATSTAKLFLGSSLEVSSGVAFSADPDNFFIGAGANLNIAVNYESNKFVNIQHVYVDDDSSGNYPGDIRVTAKEPNANNTGNFTDSFNVAAPGSRYTNTDDRPLTTTTGWVNSNTTANAENYGIENASTGDVDISAATLVARTAWVYAKKLNNSGQSGSAVTCTGNTSGTTCVTGSITVLPGQLMLCGFADQVVGTAPTISDSLSNTWTALAGPTTSTVRGSFWYSSIGAGTKAGSTAVTFTFQSSALNRAGLCAVFDGVATSTPLDKNPANTSDGTSTYTSALTGTLAQADELVAAFFAWAGPSTDTTACSTNTTTSAGTAGTSGGTASANANLRLCFATVAATTSISGNATNTTSNRAGVQSVASFKYRAAPGSGTPKITNNGTDTAVTLTTSPAVYTNIADSSTYPSNAAAVGMVASGATAATVFYEGGMLIAYTLATGTPANFFPRRVNRGG